MARTGRTGRSGRGGGTIQPFDISTTAGLEGLARQRGLTEEAERAKKAPLSVFERLGRMVTAFETGNAVYQSRYDKKSFLGTYLEDIGTGLRSVLTGREQRLTPKKYYKDILVKEGAKDRPGKMDYVDLAGFSGDILGDPTTYLGGFIGKLFLGGAKGLIKSAKALPVVGKRVKGVVEGVEDLFVPFAKVKRLGKKGEEYADAFNKYAKGTRAETDLFLDEIGKQATKVKDIPTAGIDIGGAVELGQRTGSKLLDEVMEAIVGTQKKMTAQELKRGILQTELPDYMHHMLTPQAADYLKSGGNLSQFVTPLRRAAKLGAAKGRKIEGIVADINKTYRDKLEFDLFEVDAFKAFGKRGLDSIRAVNAYDFLQRAGNQFGKKSAKDFIDEVGVEWVESKLPQLKGIRVPKAIAENLDEVQRVLTGDQSLNKFIRFYDKTLGFWKATVTGWFPAFHARNAMGGTFNNWLAGVKDPRVYKETADVLRNKKGFITIKGKKVSYEEIKKMMKEYGVIDQQGYLDIADYIARDAAPLGSKIPYKVMNVIENELRGSLFIDSLKKGLSAEQASKKVIKYHFDYMPEGFTKFERDVMRRVIPFYTWTRNNIPLQLEQIIMQPGKYAGVFKAQRAFGIRPGSEEETLVPSWMKDRFTIKGEGGYWTGFGLPFEDVAELLSGNLRGIGVQLSPFIKMPIEQLTGYNIFKDKQISEDNYGKLYKNAPQFLQDYLKIKKRVSKAGTTYYTVDPQRKYWLELIFSRGLNTALKAANAVDERASLLPLITSINKYEYNIQDLRRWRDKEKGAELEEALRRASEIDVGQYRYIPQNR
jgi:hypothetical protein